MQHVGDPLALWIILKVGLENVLDVHRIGGDDTSHTSGGSDGDRVRGVLDDNFGYPFEQSMAVFEKTRQGSNDRICSNGCGDAVV